MAAGIGNQRNGTVCTIGSANTMSSPVEHGQQPDGCRGLEMGRGRLNETGFVDRIEVEGPRGQRRPANRPARTDLTHKTEFDPHSYQYRRERRQGRPPPPAGSLNLSADTAPG